MLVILVSNISSPSDAVLHLCLIRVTGAQNWQTWLKKGLDLKRPLRTDLSSLRCMKMQVLKIGARNKALEEFNRPGSICGRRWANDVLGQDPSSYLVLQNIVYSYLSLFIILCIAHHMDIFFGKAVCIQFKQIVQHSIKLICEYLKLKKSLWKKDWV